MDKEFYDLLSTMNRENASDLHLTVGSPPIFRINGELRSLGGERLTPANTKRLLETFISPKAKSELLKDGETDTSFSDPELGRYRVNAFLQRGSVAIAIRRINFGTLDLDELGLPESLKTIVNYKKGMFLVTGPTGSGKSTTLAAIIEKIATEKRYHIITLEEPIEFLHKHSLSIINQREIGSDTKSYAKALKAALREDPDVILIGEMRDIETAGIAISAAETGHLVFSTVHTIGAYKTVDRIIDMFETDHQQQIRVQLSTALIGVLSQALIPRIDEGGRILACELMWANSAIKNLIREGKTHQIPSIMQIGQKEGMVMLDKQLVSLYRRGVIDKESAVVYSTDPDEMMKEFQMTQVSSI